MIFLDDFVCFLLLLQQRKFQCFGFAHQMIQVLEEISWMVCEDGYYYCCCYFQRNLNLKLIKISDFIACHCHQIIHCHLLRSIRSNPLKNDYTRLMSKTPINRISHHLKKQICKDQKRIREWYYHFQERCMFEISYLKVIIIILFSILL